MRKKFGPDKSINITNLSKLPDSPGVYGIYSSNGDLLKVDEQNYTVMQKE